MTDEQIEKAEGRLFFCLAWVLVESGTVKDRLTGWKHKNVINPLCGTGTFVKK